VYEMPRNYQRARPSKRRASTASRPAKASRVSRRTRIPRPFAWDKSKLVTLKYAGQFSLNPTSGAVSRYVFVANGMYDPDYSGTGHQPYSFDQIMGLYNHYTVVGSKITVRNVQSGNVTNGGFYGITLSGSADDLSGLSNETIMEHPGSTAKFISAGHQIASSLNDATITKGYSAKRFHGIPDIIGKSEYQGTSSANPVEQAFFTIWYAAVASEDAGAVPFVVNIDFYAVFTEPRTLSAS